MDNFEPSCATFEELQAHMSQKYSEELFKAGYEIILKHQEEYNQPEGKDKVALLLEKSGF